MGCLGGSWIAKRILAWRKGRTIINWNREGYMSSVLNLLRLSLLNIHVQMSSKQMYRWVWTSENYGLEIFKNLAVISLYMKFKGIGLDAITQSISVDKEELRSKDWAWGHSGTESNKDLLTCPLIRDNFTKQFPSTVYQILTWSPTCSRSLNMQP